LLECGLLHGSFIPSAEQKEVRDLTRYRMKTVQARTLEIQRLHKALESAGIKLGSVLTDTTGVSARLMVDVLIDGSAAPRYWRTWPRPRCGPRASGLTCHWR
jgi:hypothetical protein